MKTLLVSHIDVFLTQALIHTWSMRPKTCFLISASGATSAVSPGLTGAPPTMSSKVETSLRFANSRILGF